MIVIAYSCARAEILNFTLTLISMFRTLLLAIKVQRHYFGITRGFVQEFCSHCPVCQLSQPQNTRPPLHPIIENEKDFLDRVQVDLIDMRHSPDNEYHYIGHFMDHFSKFHVLFPLKRKTAEEVSYMIQERVLAYLGPPKIFHSDNGREFINSLIRSMFEKWGGDVTFVSGRPRHSQSQGLVERGNRTVEQKIAAMKQDEGHAGNKYPWVSWLPRIMFSMNCERHEGIRELPYRVVFGRYPPVGIFPGAEKHCIDEEDLPITSTCDNPHTASVHTETPIETAAPNSQLSPSIRDDENNDKGCESLISSGSAPQLASGHKDEMDAVDTDDEVEHSTFKLPSQVSNTTDEQQEEEDDSHSKATIHTAIRKKVCDNTCLAAAHMAVKYNKKKGVKTQVFSVGDKVTIGIPKMDRTKTDMPRLPCEITEVFGDKVKTYTLGTMFGTINFVVVIYRAMMAVYLLCAERLHCHFLKQPRNLIRAISSPNPSANAQVGARQIGAFVEKNGIQSSSTCHNAKTCTNNKSPLLSPADRALLDTTAWLSDMHMEAANVLLKEAFPAVDGLQNPILQQNMSFNVPSFEFVQLFFVNNNHWLVASNVGEEIDTVCIYDSMQNIPDEECISLVAKYVQCPNSHITIKVMNVQLQDNAYACGEFAVAFATSLIYGEDPTHLHYKELRSHFKNCIDTFSITQFPSTVVNHQPRVVHQIRKKGVLQMPISRQWETNDSLLCL